MVCAAAAADEAGDGDLDIRLLGDCGGDPDRRIQESLGRVGPDRDLQFVLVPRVTRDLVLLSRGRNLGLDIGLRDFGDGRLEGLLFGDENDLACATPEDHDVSNRARVRPEPCRGIGSA